MQQDADRLIELGEFLARSKFTQKDRKALVVWSIHDYKSVPIKKAVSYYKDLKNNLMPKIRRMGNNSKTNNYRADLYLAYFNLFKRHPEYKKQPNNFMAVIDRYNPPVQEALVLQQLQFNSFQQKLRMNQMMFNQTMRSQQRTADMVNNSIRDLADRQSIAISGGTILSETDSTYYVEDHKGYKYEVGK